MKRCIAFFNFGNKCILELLVATYSLRKVYSGEIKWLLSTNDEWNVKISKQVDALKVNIEFVDFNKEKKNTKSAVKPMLFNYLFNKGYESIIMCDGDLLFLKSIDALWKPLEEKGCLLTNFCNWKTSGKIMTKRISEMKDVISDSELKEICNGHTAVNIGIMGFTKNGLNALNKWTELTEKLAGKFIADEITAHYLIPHYSCYIAPSSYNASAKIGDLSDIDKNHVVHYHGGAHGGGDADIEYELRRKSSRLWLAHLYDFYRSNLVKEALMWQLYAKGGVHKIVSQNKDLLKTCYKEFFK